MKLHTNGYNRIIRNGFNRYSISNCSFIAVFWILLQHLLEWMRRHYKFSMDSQRSDFVFLLLRSVFSQPDEILSEILLNV